VSPTAERPIAVSEEDRAEAHASIQKQARSATVGGISGATFTVLIAVLLVDAIAPGLAGTARAVASAGVATLLVAPLLVFVAHRAKQAGVRGGAERVARERALKAEGRQREFATRLANALEMADTEPDALEAVERALDHVAPEAPAELLLADNSHAHLVRVAVSSADEPPGCAVDSPQSCVAARRGQTMVFPETDALDACPKLRGRPSAPGAAVCVPVSIMGRSVGVLHVTEKAEGSAPDAAVEELQALANQVGNRIGMLRVMAETELQASTDGLTGLLNRRSFENKVRVLRRQATPFALVMADLDEFKKVNDTYGHDAGDRALRIFAETLRSSARPDDILCRYGGEEFTVVLPDCAPGKAAEVMERVRVELAGLGARGEAPSFTASFGVVGCDPHEELEQLVVRADAALYRAKTQGRDRVVLDGHQPGDLGPLFEARGNGNGNGRSVSLVRDE
jgi:diguanylate cyclase (GGDEF)-like protein